MSGYQLAHLNIAKMREALESPSMVDFVNNLDRINALADQASGFVWRLKDESEEALASRLFGNDYIVNMSVWKDIAFLSDYAFQSGHVEIMRRRREWFLPMAEAHTVLWWVSEGHLPSVVEAKDRLDHLRVHGPGPSAFTFKQSYRPPARGGCMTVRDAAASEINPLAKIWFDGWRDAHAQLVPEELARLRTLKSFQERLMAALDRVRVAGPADAPIGFCLTKGSELNQLYVSSQVRGTGVAAALILDAERRLSTDGVPKAWLACAIGNERAARFYEKRGWIRAGTVIEQLEAGSGTFPLEVWRYEKLLK
jgi:GNAT superfamily N-acetyltransferase